MTFRYKTEGTCSSQINFSIDEGGKVHGVSFVDGCNGNLKGIGVLVEGMDAEKVVATLRGIGCGGKRTSCPDQLAQAVEQALQSAGNR